jgi:hypothetical protein
LVGDKNTVVDKYLVGDKNTVGDTHMLVVKYYRYSFEIFHSHRKGYTYWYGNLLDIY